MDPIEHGRVIKPGIKGCRRQWRRKKTSYEMGRLEAPFNRA
jgi:hypothetical protein